MHAAKDAQDVRTKFLDRPGQFQLGADIIGGAGKSGQLGSFFYNLFGQRIKVDLESSLIKGMVVAEMKIFDFMALEGAGRHQIGQTDVFEVCIGESDLYHNLFIIPDL